MSVVRTGSGSAPGLVRCPGQGDRPTVASGGWSATPIEAPVRRTNESDDQDRHPASGAGRGATVPINAPEGTVRPSWPLATGEITRLRPPCSTRQACDPCTGVRPTVPAVRDRAADREKRLVKGRGCPPRHPLQVDRSEAGTSPLRSTSCLPRPRLTCHDKGA